MTQSCSRQLAIAMAVGGFLQALASLGAGAEDAIFVTGRVFDRDGKSPVEGATVAVYDRRGKVVDYAKCGPDGAYVLAVPWPVLRLKKAAGGGFVHTVSSGVGRLAGGLGRVASGPLKAGIRAAATAASANPVTKLGAQAAAGLASAAIDTAAGSGRKGQIELPPGTLWCKVAAAGREDLVAPTQMYWLEKEEYKAGGGAVSAYLAWLDPACLAKTGEGASAVSGGLMRFRSVRVEPSIAEIGTSVVVSAVLPTPEEPRTPIKVVARIARANLLVPLEPVGGDRYQGTFVVSRRFPLDDMPVTVLAYAQQDARPGRDSRVEDALVRSGCFDAAREFVFDPMRVVSRNRGQASLTVVRPPRR